MNISEIKIGRDCVINFEAFLMSFSGNIIIMTWESYSDDPKIGNFGTLVIMSPHKRLPIFTMKNVSVATIKELCEIFNIALKGTEKGFKASGVINPHQQYEAMSV